METQQSGTSKVTTIGVGDFFDTVSAGYDQSIERVIPPYREMLESLFTALFAPREQPLRVLELGCGTGNLTVLTAQYFPNAHLTLVDLSEEMLAQAEKKIQTYTTEYTLLAQNFDTLTLPEASFDVILSSIALHHLEDKQKPQLYQKAFRWLKPGGEFRFADEVLALPIEQLQQRFMSLWEQQSLQNGATPGDVTLWKDHAEKYDHYASTQAHLNWLSAAGFIDVDCYWRKLLWATFGGNKPTL